MGLWVEYSSQFFPGLPPSISKKKNGKGVCRKRSIKMSLASKVSVGTRRVYGTRCAHKHRRHSPQVTSRARFFGSVYRGYRVGQRRSAKGLCASAHGYLSDSYIYAHDRQIDSPQSSEQLSPRCSEYAPDLDWGVSSDELDVGASSTDDAGRLYDFEGDQYGSMMQLSFGRNPENVCALRELRALVSSCSSRQPQPDSLLLPLADEFPHR